MKKILLMVFLGCCLLISCRFTHDNEIRGDGRITTEQRTVPAFEGIKTDGDYDVYVSSGSAQSVRIEAESNLQPYIETALDGGILEFSTRHGYSLDPRRDIKVFVTSPFYRMIRLGGSGNVTGENQIMAKEKIELAILGSGDMTLGVNSPSVVEGEISGSGSMTLSGEAREFDMQINGSGDVFAKGLRSENASVKILGSGSAEVFANRKLNVRISGSGDVRHAGPADIDINTQVLGSGSVSKIE